LSAPLRDRFGVLTRLDFYNETELSEIVVRTSDIFDAQINREAAYEIARRSRGTPRIANRLLKRVRDISQVYGEKEIRYETKTKSLKRIQVNKAGLDHIDYKLLRTKIENFKGRTVGLDTIAATIG